MKLMSTALGVPLMVLLLDASQTNFSGWRGAIDEARKGFRYHQHNLIKRFHTPAYCWRVKQWAADDPAIQKAIDDPSLTAYGHKWNPPAWNYIEPMKDATSDLLRLQNGLISPRRLHQERGRDFGEIVVETIDDNAAAIEMAIKKSQELTERTGVTVHYLQLLASPTPDGTNVAINVGLNDGE
jgi:capsid protein